MVEKRRFRCSIDTHVMLSLFVNTPNPWYLPSSNWPEKLDCGQWNRGGGQQTVCAGRAGRRTVSEKGEYGEENSMACFGGKTMSWLCRGQASRGTALVCDGSGVSSKWRVAGLSTSGCRVAAALGGGVVTLSGKVSVP